MTIRGGLARAAAAACLAWALCFPTGQAIASSGFDDTARVIAGYPVGANAFGKAEAGQHHGYAQEISTYWGEYERKMGRPMREWACHEVGRSGGQTVFYPFSGPDLPSVYELFPEADRYVLVSMQKAEAPPKFESYSQSGYDDYLSVLHKAWRFFGTLGFFRTNDLNPEASANGVPIGVTGPLMAFAARLGFRVESVDPILLVDLERDVVLRDRGPEKSDTWDSVRITLSRGGRRVLVDYVRMDLSDGSLRNEPIARKWLDYIAANPTLLKAASHHPQGPDFSIVRNSILSRAPLIVQDETGIDYDALAQSFDVSLYGKFTRPNRAFDQGLQRGLASAYQKGMVVKPLPFRLGYEKDAGSAMQVAVRDGNSRPLPERCGGGR